jgi:Putative DNA-binding domain
MTCSRFPCAEDLLISVDTIKKMSPDSLSIVEIKSPLEVSIADKMAAFPLLGEYVENRWDIQLCREFHMTDDNDLFSTTSCDLIPLYEGKMINHFSHELSTPRYWVDETQGRSRILGKTIDRNQMLGYQSYRFAYRTITSNTNQRTMICTILPKRVFCGNSINITKKSNVSINNMELLYFTSVMSSFVLDFMFRQKVATQLNIFYVYQTPIPRLTKADRTFQQIVDRAAKLICTTPEFDDLAAEVGLGSHTNGITDETARAKLRAELDGIIAHLYHLTEPEFAHILSTFPIVPQATKDAALQAYRDLAPPAAEPEIIALLQQGESNTIEFKSTARWNLRDSKKDRTMEEVILKTVAAFLNTQGGTLLIGVADDGLIVGLDLDYQTLKKKDRDGFELWLMGDLLLKEMGKSIAPSIGITFHTVDQNEICKIVATPASEPVYVNITEKSGQVKETFFIRTGNSTNKLDKPSELTKYLKRRW